MIEQIKQKFLPVLVTAFLVGGVVLVFSNFSGGNKKKTVEVVVPQLSEVASEGKVLFDANCAVCHGQNAAGTENGPSFIEQIYRPGHHGEAAFLQAAKLGVRAHHWGFGNMPPIEGVSREEVLKIIRYIRELQRANRIF